MYFFFLEKRFLFVSILDFDDYTHTTFYLNYLNLYLKKTQLIIFNFYIDRQLFFQEINKK